MRFWLVGPVYLYIGIRRSCGRAPEDCNDPMDDVPSGCFMPLQFSPFAVRRPGVPSPVHEFLRADFGSVALDGTQPWRGCCPTGIMNETDCHTVTCLHVYMLFFSEALQHVASFATWTFSLHGEQLSRDTTRV